MKFRFFGIYDPQIDISLYDVDVRKADLLPQELRLRAIEH